MKYIFELSKMTLSDIYPEGLVNYSYHFDTKDKALQQLYVLMQLYESDDYDNTILRIKRYPINDPEDRKSEVTWEYDINGKLIREIHYSEDYKNCTEFENKFKKGDFVFVQGLPWNKYANVYYGYIAIVAGVPKTLAEHEAQGWAADQWDPMYLLDYISNAGYWCHDHVVESGIVKYEEDLPQELKFLDILRKSYNGEINIYDHVWIDIQKGRLNILDVDRFSFENDVHKALNLDEDD